MKVNVFRIEHFICGSKDKSNLPQPPALVAGETEGDAVMLLSKQFDHGVSIEVTGISNVAQGVLVHDVAEPQLA